MLKLLLVALGLAIVQPAPPTTSPGDSSPSNTSPTTAPSTAPATTQPVASRLSVAQRLFLKKARIWTEEGLASIDQRLAAAQAEYAGARVGSVQGSLKDDVRRVQSKTTKNIVYTFKTVAGKKELTAKLKSALTTLEAEKAHLATGKLLAPPLDLAAGAKVNDAGELKDSVLVLEILSPRSFIGDLNADVFQVDNVDTSKLQVKQRTPLPKWAAILGQRDYLKRSGNFQTILILTAVDPFDPDQFPDEGR